MSDKHIYFRELGCYRLSVIRRTYAGYGWESEGPESAIFSELSSGGRGMSLEWIDESNQSKVFASFKSGDDVKKFLEEMKENVKMLKNCPKCGVTGEGKEIPQWSCNRDIDLI